MSVATLPARAIARHTESLADRMRRLRAEAEAAARDHSEMFIQAIGALEALADDIAQGGEAYSPGVRETARRLNSELERSRLTVEALLGR